MTPDIIASALRRIAARISASKRPLPHLVSRDLRVVLAVITNRLQTSGASDPQMSEIFEDGSIQKKIQAFLDGFNSSFGTEFEVTDVQMEDRGIGYVLIDYPGSDGPKNFKMDWEPSDVYSSFVQKLMQEIFGTELPAVVAEEGGGEDGEEPPGPEGGMPGQEQEQEQEQEQGAQQNGGQQAQQASRRRR